MTVTLQEVYETLGLRPAEVCKEVKAGRLKSTLNGMEILIEKDSLETFQVARQQETQTLKDLYLGMGFPTETEDPNLETFIDLILKACLSGWEQIVIDPVFGGFSFKSLHLDGKEFSINLEQDFGSRLRDQFLELLDGNGYLQKVLKRSSDEGHIQALVQCQPTRLGPFLQITWPLSPSPEKMLKQAPKLDRLETCLSIPGLLLITGPLGMESDRLRRAVALNLRSRGKMVVSIEHRVGVQEEELIQLSPLENESPVDLLRRALSIGAEVITIDEVFEADHKNAILNASNSGISVIVQTGRSSASTGLNPWLVEGISKALLAQSLNGIIGPLKIQAMCQECSQPVDDKDALMTPTGEHQSFWEAHGCPSCSDGELGIFTEIEFAEREAILPFLKQSDIPSNFESLDLSGRKLRLLDHLNKKRISLKEFRRLSDTLMDPIYIPEEK